MEKLFESEDCIQKSIDLDHSSQYNDKSFLLLGIINHHKENYTKAAEHFDKAIELNKDMLTQCVELRGRSLHLSGELDKASQHFEQVLQLTKQVKGKYHS